MHRKHRAACGLEVEVIQKHERLDIVANVSGTEDPGHGAMAPAGSTLNNVALSALR